MQLDKDTPKEMDLGFEIPEPGTYIWQIEEGITKYVNENSGKTSLQIPMKIDQVVDGAENAVGITVQHFVPIESTYGEKQLAVLMSITGLIEPFAKKFGDNVEPLDDKFLAALKLKMPGKFLQATHDVRENNKGQKNANFSNWCEVGTKKNPGKTASKTEADEGKQEEGSW